MPSNRAAWLNAQNEKLAVAESPLSDPGENEILIKTAAVGINPVDWKMQDYGFFIQKYPTILGCDVAGTVIKTGSGVSGFSSNDRVFAHTLNLGSGDLATAPYQEYVKITLPVAAKIPDNLSFEEAVVLPLAVDTAAAGLYQETELGLAIPPSTSGKGKTLLVWGGSGAVGSACIQLASQAGYEVITTASQHNHQFCKSLGAAQVFDYKSNSIAEDLISALKGKDVVGGYDSISEESTIKTCCRVLAQSGGVKTLVTTLPGTDQHATDGVSVKPIFALTVASNGIGEKLWKWLPDALKSGAFKAQPEPMVAGKGLDSLQKGMDVQKAGVSGKKVVISF